MRLCQSHKAASLFIFITAAIDCIGIGLIIPSLPSIMRRFISTEFSVSEYYGYFISTYALMQFLSSPLLGRLSDRFGRRPVLLVSMAGSAIDYMLMAFAPSLWLLFIGRIFSGLTGANFTVALAYIADVSNDKNRSANFGLIGAAFGLGFIIGPALGGLLGSFGPQAPFIAAAILNGVNFLFGFFVLPESLPKELRRPIDFKRLNPFGSLRRALSPSPILAFIVVHFLFQTSDQVHPAVWTLYTQHKFGWSTAEVGAYIPGMPYYFAALICFFSF